VYVGGAEAANNSANASNPEDNGSVPPNDDPVTEEEVDLNNVMDSHRPAEKRELENKSPKGNYSRIKDPNEGNANIIPLDSKAHKEIVEQIDNMTSSGLRFGEEK
jgi:hypothetical protein